MNEEEIMAESIGEMKNETTNTPLIIQIDAYYKGFHSGITLNFEKNGSIPAGKIMTVIDSLIEKGFEPSWNKETSKEQLKSAAQEFVDSISDDPTAPICGIHHSKMVWKTGVSKKTNKRYAFWGCDQRLPDGGFCTFKPIMPEGGSV